MRVKLRFPLKEPFQLTDAWPIEVEIGRVEFELDGQMVRALTISFAGQSLDLAPTVTPPGGTPHIRFAGVLEERARQIVRRFRDFISLYFQVDIRVDHVEYQYEPESEEEDRLLEIRGFNLNSPTREPSILPFGLVASAVFATDADLDPSFAATMLRLGRANIREKQWIEGFRYFFMLIEGLYGDGQFKKAGLNASFSRSEELAEAIRNTLESLRSDPIEANNPARSMLPDLPDVETVIRLLVDRRGFYFHSNLRRTGGWHPDRQDEAEALCWLSAGIAQELAFAFTAPMHAPDVNTRYLQSAKSEGALMQVDILFVLDDDTDRHSDEILTLDVPGTHFTTDLAFTVLKHACDWAEVNKLGDPVRLVLARNAQTREELFRTQLFPNGSGVEEAVKRGPSGSGPTN